MSTKDYITTLLDMEDVVLKNIYSKRSRRLLLKHRDDLVDEDKAALDIMLRFSGKLVQGYFIDGSFLPFHGCSEQN